MNKDKIYKKLIEEKIRINNNTNISVNYTDGYKDAIDYCLELLDNLK